MGSAEKIPLSGRRAAIPASCHREEVGWGNSWNMSELDFPLTELRKLEEGGELAAWDWTLVP